MDWFQHVIGFFDNTIVKMACIFVGTFLLRKWPALVNQSLSFWTGLYSVGLTVLHALFPDQAPAATHVSVALASYEPAGLFSHGSFLERLLQESILPWVLGYGGQRTADHTIIYMSGKGDTGGDAPQIQDQPFQTFKK